MSYLLYVIFHKIPYISANVNFAERGGGKLETKLFIFYFIKFNF